MQLLRRIRAFSTPFFSTFAYFYLCLFLLLPISSLFFLSFLPFFSTTFTMHNS